MSILALFLHIAAFLQAGGLVYSGTQAPTLTPPASMAAEKDKCVVAGKVVSAQTGEPLKKVDLQLVLRFTGRSSAVTFQQTGYSATSAADGSFLFEGVEPGEYTLHGQKSGYIRTTYGSKAEIGTGTVLTLTAGQKLTDLKFPLTTQATISGRVLDEDGDPVGGARVQAYGKMGYRAGKARYLSTSSARADDTGAFRLANIRPGKYYLAAQANSGQVVGMVEKPAIPGKPDVRPVPTYYPSALRRTDGTAIEVTAGQDKSGVEIRLRSAETFHVRGKLVVEENSGDQDAMEMLTLRPVGDNETFALAGNMVAIGQDHTFDMSGVLPGSYVLTRANMRTNQGVLFQKIEVGEADVNGVILTPQPGFSIKGSVEVQAIQPKNAKDKPAENIRVLLVPDDPAMAMLQSSGVTKVDGSLTIDNVAPAKVRIRVTNLPEGSYVQSVRFGNQETLGKVLDLTQASGGEMRIVIRGGAPKVNGTVMSKQANGAALVANQSAQILLIPEDLTLNGGEVHRAQTNQNGGFTVAGLRPATYYAVAFDGGLYRGFDDPAQLKQLASKGVKVDLKENDKQQIQLSTLPPEDLAAIEAAGDN